MKFLNLDLDFFLNEIAHDPPSMTRRAPKKCYKPWPEPDLRKFLEQRCGLNRQSRIVGRYGIHHKAVFDYWRCLIKTAPSGTQINLTHVDAHGDFNTMIDMGLSFIRKTLLYHQPDHRLYVIDQNPHHVTLANYMSFAVACRWIERIEFVTHPKWKLDFSESLFKNKRPDTGLIELRANGIDAEPAVPITFTPEPNFSQAGFSQAFLCQSPNYTPQTADALIPVFEDYIDFNAA